jgi:transglutaminase-like putative cysteine protease
VTKSLGKSGDITKAQHCRAEVYIDGKGWFPVDPADVRKVVLEENIPVDGDKVKALRERHPDRVLDRHGRIDTMDVVEVDDIGFEPLQAVLAGRLDVLRSAVRCRGAAMTYSWR